MPYLLLGVAILLGIIALYLLIMLVSAAVVRADVEARDVVAYAFGIALFSPVALLCLVTAARMIGLLQ